MTIRDAEQTDAVQLADIFNRGFNKSIWCSQEFLTSAWTIADFFYLLQSRYGKGRVIVKVAEEDGRILAADLVALTDDEIRVLGCLIEPNLDRERWAAVNTAVIEEIWKEHIDIDRVTCETQVGVWVDSYVENYIKATRLEPGSGKFVLSLSEYFPRKQ